MRIAEALGRAIGGVLSPLAFEGSLIRGARVLHPSGVVYRAEVRGLARTGTMGKLARRLDGEALVRLSGALYRQERLLPELLGVAVRLRRQGMEQSAAAQADDQDLLFTSSRSVLQLPLATITTNSKDFLANDYHAMLPFFVSGIGEIKLRLASPEVRTTGRDRLEKLERAVEARLAVFRLEARLNERGERWEPVVSIELREKAPISQQELGFSPTRDGRGLRPVGLLNGVRVAVYPASQLGRQIAKGMSEER